MGCRGCGQRAQAQAAQQLQAMGVPTAPGAGDVVVEYVGLKMGGFTVVGQGSKRAYIFGASPANRQNVVDACDVAALVANPEFRVVLNPGVVPDRQVEIGMNNPQSAAFGLAGPRV